MPIVRFFGRTWPPWISITINNIPEAGWEEAALDLIMVFRIQVIDCSIEVECEVNQFRDEFIPTLYMRALDLARVAVDLLAFSSGYSLMVLLDSYAKPGRATEPLWFQDVNLAPLCTAYKIPAVTNEEMYNLSNTIAIVGSEPALFMALNDLIQGISVPHHAPVNCGRAIDGLRNILTPVGVDREKGWPILRDTLRVEKAYLDFVMSHSTGPRHGDRAHKPGYIVVEITKRAWTLMNRFIEFRKRGDRPLPEEEFPLLMHQEVIPHS